MKLPAKFEEILKTNQTIYSIVLDVISTFELIFNDNKLYFFEEYTNHGINHIENVLEASEYIITDESFNNITSNEIAILIYSIILHDLGMHIELPTFNSLLNGEYDKLKIDIIDSKTWKELWDDYLSEVKRFSSIQKMNVFGNESIPFNLPNLTNKDNLNGYDKKLIGEFIRRNHGRFAQEIALFGLKGENQLIEFGTNKLDIKTKELAGILARSHSMDIRDTFDYLKDNYHDSWINPHNINIIYLMVVLRISDYIQINNTRVDKILLKLKSFNSPISKLETETHLAINSINFNQIDSEKIFVDCSPNDSEMYVKIKTLIGDIQNEFDKSWAILGEIYGFIPKNKPAIKFRRISSNLESKSFLNKLNFIPEKITFKVDNNLSKLLVAPLYGDKPTFGVRELLQNSIDACLERKEIEYFNKNFNYTPLIEISIERINENQSLFTIKDNGKGMSSNEIINYFLNVGNSFRKSMDWKKQFVNEEGKSKINRNGKFGVGVLASFLLGKEINVISKSLLNNEAHSFKASIDSQFINISKTEEESSFGTTITILLNNENRDKLLYHTTDNYYDKSIEWTKWFLYEEPKIVYSVDKEIIEIKNHLKGINLFEFSTENFEKISWFYKNDSYSKLIACNGIIITEKYSINRFNINNKEGHNCILVNKPNILVIDKEGVFPVKLDRNDVDCDEFPFEDELFLETAKHFIAQLLNFEIKNGELKNHILLHNVKILYNSEGFVLNSDYFINGIKDKYNLIRLITENSKIKIDLKKYKNHLFYIVFNEKIQLTYQESNVAPQHGGRIILKKENFNQLFKSTVKRLPNYVKNNTKIIEEDDDYVIYSIYDHNFESNLLKSLKEIDLDILSKVGSIQEIKPNYFNNIGGEILNELFAKYIKNNFVIPYDLEKRKEIYKEAFKELEYYMK
ncbi:HD domain-containing protein [Flavobacterium eburneipallidum]|uniref:HD domain-containing protein n=1 Tax=Flavobacterium eburneipallidum TaxID=3003263 RepID=UPI0022AC5EE4|nr:ATP-binding protein [Flavobacterium eburneipallidum]